MRARDRDDATTRLLGLDGLAVTGVVAGPLGPTLTWSPPLSRRAGVRRSAVRSRHPHRPWVTHSARSAESPSDMLLPEPEDTPSKGSV